MRPLAAFLSIFLASTLAHALPVGSGGGGGSGDPPKTCADKVTGHLSASSTSINPGESVTLSWSTSVPAGCTAFHGVHVAYVAVANTGSMTVTPSGTTSYYLTETTSYGTITLDAVTITVGNVPKYVSVSSGHAVTTNDLAQFDAMWTQPAQHQGALAGASDMLQARFGAGVWMTADRMDALARMYGVTHDIKYLQQLHDFVEVVLQWREDRRPDGQIDQYRNKIMAGWGGAGISDGGMFRADEVVSSVYTYPIAAFARIVADDPSLQPQYGADAVRYANAVAETAWAFMPQMRYRPDGNQFQAYLQELDIYKTMPSDAQCDAAYNQTIAQNPDAAQDTIDWWGRQRNICYGVRASAGLPKSHNENLAFTRFLMEVYHALDSDLYKQSPDRSVNGEPLRVLIPVLVARQTRYFMGHVELTGDRYRWHYSDEGAPGGSHDWEDTSHGGLDMKFHEVLRRDFARLNAASSALGEPIPLDPADAGRFANAFLEKVSTGPSYNFAEGVEGGTADPIDHRDGECAGWVSLTSANDAVWSVCQEMALRILGERQPYLTIGSHAALLEAKKWIPLPVRPPRVPITKGAVFEP